MLKPKMETPMGQTVKDVPNPPPSPQTKPEPEKATISYPEPDLEMGPEPGVEFPASDQAGDEAGADPHEKPQDGESGIMSRDDFFELFSGLIESPNIVLTMKGVDPLESLVVEPGDPQARKASDALYKTCLKVRWLRFMLAPETEWAKDLMVVGLFIWGKFRLVRAELEILRVIEKARSEGKELKGEEKPDRDPEQQKPQGANDDKPGVDQGVTILEVGVKANG